LPVALLRQRHRRQVSSTTAAYIYAKSSPIERFKGTLNIMAVCELHLSSNNVLGKMISVNVILPDSGNGPYPVLYLLHGLSDDHTAWVRRTSIERYVENLGLMVVMPCTDRGWYTDAVSVPNAAYETAITQDIIGFVDRSFRTKTDRGGRAVAGLSMGGYGALKLGLKHPDKFCAAVSHSGAPAAACGELTGDNPWVAERRLIFGEKPGGGDNDVFALAEKADPATRPALRFDCGLSDGLIEQNRALDKHLTKLGIPHEYEEHPGDHNWAFWDLHIQDTLQFIKKPLGLA